MNESAATVLDFDGMQLAAVVAGKPGRPALVLIHGFPSSSESFRHVIAALMDDFFVIAPDLPGFGRSEPVSRPSFARFADIIDKLLSHLGVASFHLYLHDYGATVALYLATRKKRSVRSLIIQNANAHSSGLGPQWKPTQAFWKAPTPERKAKATEHLTLEGTRHQYVGGVPSDIAKRMDACRWEEDWRVMSLPGRLDTQRALVLDYRRHVARYGAIASYLARWQPPALMLWGRHDAFFDIRETLAWMRALPRMEAHILDGAHFLLETHAPECAAIMKDFLQRVESCSS